MDVTLQQFLTAKSLGVISLGMTKQQIAGVLGEPPHWSGIGQWLVMDSPIWCYGSMQMNFEGEELETLMWNQGPLCRGSVESFHFVDAEEKVISRLEGFRHWLTSNEITFRETQNSSWQMLVIFPSGACARYNLPSRIETFSEEDAPGGEGVSPAWELVAMRASREPEDMHPWAERRRENPA